MIELSYIESTGTQWIDSGLIGNNTFKIEVKYIIKSWNPSYGWNPVIGNIQSTTNRFGIGAWGPNDTPPRTLIWCYNSNYTLGSNTASLDNEYTQIIDKNLCYLNGELKYTFGSTSFTTLGNITIFGCAISGSTVNRFSRIQLYYAKIWNNDNLVRDFIPAKDDNNVVCLYDRVSETYFYNSGSGTFIGGDPVTGSYTIHFNANGGTGIMSNQRIYIDTPTPLTLNTFTREHYIFRGWATSQYGEVVYTDGETVTNIGEADETVNLFAVWQPLPMSIKIQYNASEKNRMDKDVTTKMTLWGTLKAECSIIDPVVLIECNLLDIVDCNYITIDLFNRSYFVNNIRSIRKNLNELSCHVDVLSSFKDEIRTNNAILSKSENDWNLYLNDGSLKTYQNAEVVTKPFPAGFSSQSFVLAIAGS